MKVTVTKSAREQFIQQLGTNLSVRVNEFRTTG